VPAAGPCSDAEIEPRTASVTQPAPRNARYCVTDPFAAFGHRDSSITDLVGGGWAAPDMRYLLAH
jgi:hypothetical protein